MRQGLRRDKKAQLQCYETQQNNNDNNKLTGLLKVDWAKLNKNYKIRTKRTLGKSFAKPDTLSSTPRTPMRERTNSWQLSCDCHMCLHAPLKKKKKVLQ